MRKNYFTIISVFAVLVTIVIFISCDFLSSNIKSFNAEELVYEMDEIESPEIINRQWSLLIYMAADNDLEASALEDIFEMELSHLNTNKVSVFVLLDRSNSYDSSNYNWSGTKLYKLKTGRSPECKTIISEEISCEEIGLEKDSYTELDMSSKYTLAKTINFIKKQYPSEQLGLIMWGHGTGWRGKTFSNVGAKGFAYDDSTGSYMTLKQFGDGLSAALNGQKLDFLGLDTCFGGEIEVMYELRNKTKYAVGTEGLVLLSGWDYEKIFNKFNDFRNKSPRVLANICIDSFSKEYELSTCASIVGVDMALMDSYFMSFDSVMKTIANSINDKNTRDAVFTSLYSKNNGKTKFYSYGKENCDVYLDIVSAINTCKLILGSSNRLEKEIKTFNEIKERCVFNSWASDRMEGGLGVYFGTLTAGNLIGAVHDRAYVKDAVMEQIQFVKDSQGYVPGQKEKDSLIDKLFYKDY